MVIWSSHEIFREQYQVGFCNIGQSSELKDVNSGGFTLKMETKANGVNEIFFPKEKYKARSEKNQE